MIVSSSLFVTETEAVAIPQNSSAEVKAAQSDSPSVIEQVRVIPG